MGARIAVAIGFALLVSGCNPEKEFRYSTEGIGTEITRSDIASVTITQTDYIQNLCRQIGLTAYANTEDCNTFTYPSQVWPLIVQAGMNDIDARCDDFLAWVDYRRRNDRHWAQQISDTVLVTNAIVRATSGQVAIDVVAIALGYASNTFANTSGMLLMAAEQTTVHSAVLSEQMRLRSEFRGLGSQINNRPAAVHALRNYLRVCMPMTIATNINSTSTIYSQSGVGGLQAKRQLISAKDIKAAFIIPDAETPILTPPLTPPVRIAPWQPDDERDLHAPVVKKYQAVLCLKEDGNPGNLGSTTRNALMQYLVGLYTTTKGNGAGDPIEPTPFFLRKVQNRLDDAFDRRDACKFSTFQTAYEVGRFGGANGPAVVVAFKTSLTNGLRQRGVTVDLGTSPTFDPATRNAIAQYRAFPAAPRQGAADRQVDTALDKKLAGS